MKTLIAVICLLASVLCASAQFTAAQAALLAPSAGGGGGACSPAQGNTLTNEGFETLVTGYQQTGWGTADGTPVPNFDITALTSGKPNGSCNQGFSVVFNNNAPQGNLWDSGSGHASTLYVRFYIYVVTDGILDSDYDTVLAIQQNASTGVGNRNNNVELTHVSGVLKIGLFGGSRSTPITITSGAWHYVEVKSTVGGGTSEIKVDGGSVQTCPDSGYGQWQAIYAGCNNGAQYSPVTFVIDQLAADTTGYIGPTP